MIRCEGLTKKFGAKTVLQELNLTIPEGDRVALVGFNGAGKTTLIRCLLGEYIYQGKVSIENLDPRKNRCEVLRKIGFVPQLPPPLKMPVFELMEFAAQLNRSDKHLMEEVAEQLNLNLSLVRKQPFFKLSGGQKQKVLIAIALGKDAELLIMDEPAANLDPEARAVLFSLLAERRNTTMIISSHRLDEVAGLVNRVLELDLGKLVLDEKVAKQAGLEDILDCRLEVLRDEPALAKTLVEDWNFAQGENALAWQGVVQGPDRLRFFGALSRYSGLLRGIHMEPSATNQGERER
jgi:ABC-2 type transport system ATP-binding protein